MLDADIIICYHRINHKALLKKVNTFPSLNPLLKSWLKAGFVVDKDNLFPTNEGASQAGTISPLLANIALHGLENLVKELMGNNVRKRKSLSLIRYHDDVVVLHEDLAASKKCQDKIEEWLSEME